MNSQPEVIAHRGGRWPETSENTLAAFTLAAEAGVEWMETDVHASADGVLFAAHDADLSRIAGRPHLIRELPAAELDRSVVAGCCAQMSATARTHSRVRLWLKYIFVLSPM